MFQKGRMRNHSQCCFCPNELTTAGNSYLRMVLKTIYYDGRDVLGVVRRHEWCLLTLKLQKHCCTWFSFSLSQEAEEKTQASNIQPALSDSHTWDPDCLYGRGTFKLLSLHPGVSLPPLLCCHPPVGDGCVRWGRPEQRGKAGGQLM